MSDTSAEDRLLALEYREICSSGTQVNELAAIYPLTLPQREIWFDQMLYEQSPMYNIGGYVRVAGVINPKHFERAVNLLIRKHDCLRTVLIKGPGTGEVPTQRFAADMAVRVPLHDFTSAADPQASALGWMQARLDEPFSLYGEQLARYDLLKLGEEMFYAFVRLHHMIVDGWSLALLCRSLAKIYSALELGVTPDLTAHSYVEFIKDDQSYVEGHLFKRQRQYWLEKYRELPDSLLRPRYRGSEGASTHSECCSLTLPRRLYDRLIALAKSSQAAVFQVILAALYVYFVRSAEREELVIGLPVLNRSNAAYRETAGLFVSVSAMRFGFGTALSFAELVRSIARVLKQDYRHQRFPISELNRELLLRTDRRQIFDLRVSYERHDYDSMFGSAPARVIALLNSHQQAALTLFVREFHDDEDVSIDFVYNRACFQSTEIEAIQRRMLGIFRSVVDDADIGVEHIPLITTDDAVRLRQWNATHREYPSESCIHELFQAQAEQTPHAVALVCGECAVPYAELGSRASRLACRLQELGVGPEVRVAICAERSIELVVGLLATLKAGGAYVPLDPAYPRERLSYMLLDSGAKVLLHGLIQAEVLQGVQEEVGAAVELIDLCADAAQWGSPGQTTEFSHSGAGSRNLAYVIYTSGSTGRPKGVMVEHRSVCNLISWHCREFGLGEGRRSSMTAGVAFDASTWEIWPALCSGGTLVLAPGRLSGDAAQLLEWWRQQRLDVSFLVTPLAELACSEGGINPALNYLLVGGDRLSRVPVREGLVVVNNYGPTETTVVASSGRLSTEEPVLHIGRPIANTKVHLLDKRAEPVPVGVVGEIYIGGAGVARGYLNRPELTAERFVPDPFSAEPDERMYRTGDLARYLDDGDLEYLGRTDYQVKIRGFRIEIEEIEECLRQQNGIREAVVLAREDQRGGKRLVAYFVSAGGLLEVGQLRERLACSLPEYMLPVAYVQLESLPLTANGKLDRRALPPPQEAAFVQREYEEPRGGLESALAQMWSELLGVPRVGRQDHFFELGGHSLLAMQLLARVRQRLGQEVPLQQLFAHPVLQRFAQWVSQAQRSQLPPLQALERPSRVPLSFAQQRLWFIAQLDGAAAAAYHIPVGLRLRGHLDRSALQQALDRIVSRHEALRTHFELLDGQPGQRMAPPGRGVQLQHHDLRGHPDGQQQVRHWSQWEAHTAFDLQQGPLIRARLLQLDDQENVLLITMHHIVSDGWSLGVLKRELSVLYRAFSRGEDDPLPPLSIQYADYALWQRQWMEDVLQQQLLYWKLELQGAPALISLPTDRARPAVQDYMGERIEIELDERLSEGIRLLSRRHGTTLPMTLLAAWAALAARLSGQTEVVIGTPVANRTRAEVEELIGFFVNTLALRIEVSSNGRVGELLEQVRRRSVEGQSHQEVPFEQVVEGLRPVRSLSHSPIFQLMFAWENSFGDALDLEPLRIEALKSSDYRRAKYDLTLSLREVGQRIVGELEYASALYECSTMHRHRQSLLRLLEGMVADDQQLISRLPLLSEVEREQLLVEWNETHREYPQDRGVHELFESQVERLPEAVALVCEGQSLTYAALNQRANRLACHLKHLGVGPEVRVALCADRGIELVVGCMATLKAGGAYVPLDPAYPRERLSYMLQDSGAAVLLHAQLPAQMPSQLLEVASTTIVLVDLCADVAQWASRSGQNQDGGARSHNLAYVIYTSGSTGRPKGVMTPHRGAVNRLAAQGGFAPFHVNEVCCQKTSIGFVDSIYETLGPLTEGLRLVVAPAAASRDLEELTALIERAGVTCLVSVPSMAHALLERSLAGRLRGLRSWTLSGEALETSLLRRLHEAFPGCRIINLYGSSEVCADATSYVSQGPVEGMRVPIGRPIRNMRVYVLDEHREPVPIGVTGEIYIGGAGVARGYLNQPKLTAERFMRDPFHMEADAHIYRTGDLGRYLADGNLEYLGRTDYQVKIRGFRIELGEIERCLLQQPGIRAAAVLAREDQPGEKRLVAYVISESAPLDARQLREQLSRSLPEYMLPVAYVRMESLPLTANGKLDRRALPMPEGAALVQREYEEPHDGLESALAQIWSELLRVERVGRQDHFFELGGHSLLAVQLMERMRRQGMYADIRTLFMQPTLAGLAQAVGQAQERGWADVVVPPNRIEPGSEVITPEMLPLVQLNQQQIDRIVRQVPGGAVNVQDIYPLAPLQEGIFFHHLLQQQGDAYLLVTTLSFDRRERLKEFVEVLQQVISRHDVLRTAVLWEGLRRPVQVVWREARLLVEEIHLNAADADIAEQLFARFDPARVRMDVGRAPLLSVAIAHDEPKDRWLMLLRLHHLVVDYTGMEIIQEEAQAYLQGREQELARPQPFRNFVARARLGVPNQEHEEFFRQMLGDVHEPTAPYGVLQVDRNRTQVQEEQQPVESTLAQDIRRQARQLGVSAASIFHFAWARVLARTSRRTDVVFGTVLLGRMYAGEGSDRALGMFINTLPLRVRLGELTVGEGIRSTHETLAQLMRHEHASLALVQRCSGLRGDVPLFSALLNYRHRVLKSTTAGVAASHGMQVLSVKGRTNYPCTLSVDDLGSDFSLTLQVVSQLPAQRICRYMQQALEEIVKALEQEPLMPALRIGMRDEERERWQAHMS